MTKNKKSHGSHVDIRSLIESQVCSGCCVRNKREKKNLHYLHKYYKYYIIVILVPEIQAKLSIGLYRYYALSITNLSSFLYKLSFYCLFARRCANCVNFAANFISPQRCH